MWRPLHRHTLPFGRSDGQSLVELALILPIFLLLIAGAVDLGRLFYAYVSIVNASKEGALFGATEPQCFSPAECADPRNVVFHVQADTGSLTDTKGKKLMPTWKCLPAGSSGSAGPGAGARTATTPCPVGSAYEVGLTYDFQLITPILGSLLNGHLILAAKADATVVNPSYTSIPGLSVTKEVWDPDAREGKGDWVRTPSVNAATGARTNLEFVGGTTVSYRITVSNTGVTAVSGIAIDDDAFKRWSDSRCPPVGTLPAGGTDYRCPYQVRLPPGPAKDRTNTVTVTTPGLAPVVDIAIIDILPSPSLAVDKRVGVFREGPFSSDLTVHRSSLIDPTVWYQLRVTNDGAGQATGVTILDNGGQLPFGPDCRRPDDRFRPGERYTCVYQDLLDRIRTFTNTLSADSDQTAPVTDTIAVRVEACRGQDLVVPNLAEDENGTARSMSEARAAWAAAGFSGTVTRSFASNPPSQDPAPFECAPATSAATVALR